jgi:NAD(P) transhydrogenase subunit alpha
MLIGILKESLPRETRVAATPATVTHLVRLGYEVVVESRAGAASRFTDHAYVDAGASVGDPLAADIVFGVNALIGAARRSSLRSDPHHTDVARAQP